jgi:hypothetical protein
VRRRRADVDDLIRRWVGQWGNGGDEGQGGGVNGLSRDWDWYTCEYKYKHKCEYKYKYKYW